MGSTPVPLLCQISLSFLSPLTLRDPASNKDRPQFESLYLDLPFGFFSLQKQRADCKNCNPKCNGIWIPEFVLILILLQPDSFSI